MVIGGGNVAIDAARCAVRLGVRKVIVMYRRSENEMPARKDEILYAKEEGIEFLFMSDAVEFIGNEGKVCKVRYVSTVFSKKDDASGRKSVQRGNKEHYAHADLVIVAVGNLPSSIIKESGANIDFDNKGRIRVDDTGVRTSHRCVYAGGDAVTGSATVVHAMHAGKKAASQIHLDLS